MIPATYQRQEKATRHDSHLPEAVKALLEREPEVASILGIQLDDCLSLATLFGQMLRRAVSGDAIVARLAEEILSTYPDILDASIFDLGVAGSKDFEGGGHIRTALFSNGFHAVLGHRIANGLWEAGRENVALALKTSFGRAFSTDIHPAARIGKGFWLDHGIGLVIGETAVIGDWVCMWHGVTLGSTLKAAGERRHPRIGDRATICAGATILGGVTVGEGAVVAAGSIVLRDVAEHTTVAGVPAKTKDRRTDTFRGFHAEAFPGET